MLISRLLSGDQRLQQCAMSNPRHVKQGDKGPYVKLIQLAMLILGDLDVDDGEMANQYYGSSTAAAVLDYKQKRNIINPAYQSQADDIVGIMTIKAIDAELAQRELAAVIDNVDPSGGVDVRTDRD